MNKRFVITITEIGQEERTIGREWKKGAGADPDDFGYTPETKATRDYEREVFKQTVPDLDLAKVISAVNGLGET